MKLIEMLNELNELIARYPELEGSIANIQVTKSRNNMTLDFNIYCIDNPAFGDCHYINCMVKDERLEVDFPIVMQVLEDKIASRLGRSARKEIEF